MHQKAQGPTPMPIGNVRHRDLCGRPLDELISLTAIRKEVTCTRLSVGGRRAR
jgi:hypothetical protein